MNKALSGITVIDLSEAVAGPVCTMMMADLGAEIIKVEQVNEGDSTRRHTPKINGASPVFTAYNRNKKGIALDLNRPEGIQIVKKLLKKADVLLDSFEPGTMEKLGLDYESLKEEFPQLICASITGYGATGPYAGRPLYEGTLQAEGGMSMSLMDESNGTPYLVGGSLAQTAGAHNAMIAIQGALHQKHVTGRGQKIDVNMYTAITSMFNFPISDYLFNGREKPQNGNGPTGFVRAKDGWMRVAAGEQDIWKRAVELIGDPVMSEERFYDVDTRNANELLLVSRIELWTLQRTRAEAIEAFTKIGIPCGAVRTIEDLRYDPHLEVRKHIIMMDVPGVGELPYFGSPYRLEHSPVEYSRAPELGEHTETVLQERLGMDAQQIAALREAGILG